MPEGKDDADRRTVLAEQRTVLANERTFNSWLRTGLAAAAAGFALAELFAESEPLVAVAGSLLILLGIAFAAVGAWRFRAVAAQSGEDGHALAPWVVVSLTAAFVLVSLAALVLVAFD